MLKASLNRHAMQVLKPALISAKSTIKKEIRTGKSHLYLTDNQQLYVVVRPEGSELVIVAVAGNSLLLSQQEIVNFAKTNGFSTLRFHATHPERLKKGLQGLAYYLVEKRQRILSHDEYVFRVDL